MSEAESLRIAPGADLFDLHRLRFLDGLLVVLEHNRLPLAACPALADTDFNTASLYATLRAADPPQTPRVADYSCEARHPTPREIELFEIGETMPMLVATTLTFNQAGRPIELTTQVYRGTATASEPPSPIGDDSRPAVAGTGPATPAGRPVGGAACPKTASACPKTASPARKQPRLPEDSRWPSQLSNTSAAGTAGPRLAPGSDDGSAPGRLRFSLCRTRLRPGRQ
ncbi:UTRA domain-containing protein [Plantactinospora veratri]